MKVFINNNDIINKNINLYSIVQTTYFNDNLIRGIKNNNLQMIYKQFSLSSTGNIINKFIIDNIHNDIIIINLGDKINIKYNIKCLIYYPIFIQDNDNFILILTPHIISKINGFNNYLYGSTLYLDTIYKTHNIIGTFLSNKQYQIKNIIPNTGIKNLLFNNKLFLSNLYIPNLSNIHSQKYPQNPHGWLSYGTKYNIEILSQFIKPKVICELGIWLGKSSRLIREKYTGTMYCFDNFRELVFSQYSFKKFNYRDFFYFLHPRIETFISNMNKFKDFHIIKTDNFKFIKICKKYNITPELVYIDFIKKINKLLLFIQNIFIQFPNCNIIGDDLIGIKDKHKIKLLAKKYNKNYYQNKYSYIITNINIPTYYKFNTQFNDFSYIENNYHNIKNNYNTNDTDTQLFFISNIIEHNDFHILIKYIKKWNIDMNKNNKYLNVNNTIYHEIYRYIKNNEDNTLLQLFHNIQTPLPTNNDFYLTYLHYIKYNIQRIL